MRDFFIRGFELLVGVLVVLMLVGVLFGAGAAAFGGLQINGMPMGGGPVAGIAILIGGFLYVTLVAGMLYLGLGIYQNTRRTAEAVDRLARRQG